jgi:DNA (cytosine-5)-methyltransferase 1
MLDFVTMPINPDTPRLFNVISTFAGCGGSSLGYKWAGGKVLAAVEWDENAVQTYRLNHKDTIVLHRDITTVTAQELLDLTGLKAGELDIFDGSPPCQGFSTAGKRQIDDPRNSLFREYVRLLRGLKPKVFVMENVSGMVKGDMKHVFAIAMRELKASGYQVKCQLMNAMYFGVPQSRQRVIFIGVRDDLGIAPSYPKPQTLEIGISSVIADIKATRSMKINPWIFHPRAAATITKTDSDYQFLCKNNIIRKPAIAEVARLASYPESFQWNKDGWARIGNSVPPKFMQAIASHIYTNILSAIPVHEVSHA